MPVCSFALYNAIINFTGEKKWNQQTTTLNRNR